MKELTSRERFARMYAHREADRVPVIDSPWAATIERWEREGMPADVGYEAFFGLDRIAYLGVDNSPRLAARLVEETPEYTIRTTEWGVTLRNWKHAASTPEFLEFTVVDPASWQKVRARIAPDRDRIPWDHLKKNYPLWQQQGARVEAGLWFGFDVTHSWMVGTERLLCAMVEEPEWCMDMFAHLLDVHLALFDMVWDAGYRFDGIRWPDDMGYKLNQFFSVDMYRALVKPFHKRAIEWAHAKGITASLHSCGDVNPFVPELLEIGLDALNPIEVKAGMDPVRLKRTYGDRLVLHGGINAVLWDRPEAVKAEIERLVPIMKAGGGYIFSSDHSVPSSVSLEDFRQIIALAKRVGSYA